MILKIFKVAQQNELQKRISYVYILYMLKYVYYKYGNFHKSYDTCWCKRALWSAMADWTHVIMRANKCVGKQFFSLLYVRWLFTTEYFFFLNWTNIFVRYNWVTKYLYVNIEIMFSRFNFYLKYLTTIVTLLMV